MGNVNGREDGVGGNSPSGVEEEEDGGGSAHQSMAAQDGRYGNHGDGGEFMGQSPPPSPRASHSPLMFRPQASSFIFLK